MVPFEPCRPEFQGAPRVDERSQLGRIVEIDRDGFPGRDAPRKYGSHKAIAAARAFGVSSSVVSFALSLNYGLGRDGQGRPRVGTRAARAVARSTS